MLRRTADARDWVLLKPFWLKSGPCTPVDWALKGKDGIQRFVLTSGVQNHLRDLASAVAANVAPILLQV